MQRSSRRGASPPPRDQKPPKPVSNARLLTARVAAAFRATGLVPARRVLVTEHGRACGLAAVTASMSDGRFKEAKMPTYYMAAILRLDEQYCLGWVGGWDDESPAGFAPPTPWEECPPLGLGRRRWGWFDGAAAAAEIIGAAH